MIGIDDVRAAARRLGGVTHRTPVWTSRTLDARSGARVHLKVEALQRTGSFKLRGAFNRVAMLDPQQRARGVIAYSSGNHAQAVALAAREHGTAAVIVLPRDAPRAKREATAGYGAEIIDYDPAVDRREELATAVAAERGLALVKPYDDPLVMAGQGTVALELLDDCGRLDHLLVPVGGGGLIAGCATVVSALSPRTRVVGVEPAGADDTRRSLAAGRRVRVTARGIADGLLAPTPGELTFEVNRHLVDEVVTVSDDEIRAAMAFLFDRLKLVTEPSGAVGVAAALAGRLRMDGSDVGVIVSGGNVGLERFCALVGAPAKEQRLSPGRGGLRRGS